MKSSNAPGNIMGAVWRGAHEVALVNPDAVNSDNYGFFAAAYG